MMLLKSDRKIGWNANPCTERYMDKVGKKGKKDRKKALYQN